MQDDTLDLDSMRADTTFSTREQSFSSAHRARARVLLFITSLASLSTFPNKSQRSRRDRAAKRTLMRQDRRDLSSGGL